MLAYFMSRVRIDALHVDVNDVLPPNGTHFGATEVAKINSCDDISCSVS